jgi:hypothetical protein
LGDQEGDHGTEVLVVILCLLDSQQQPQPDSMDGIEGMLHDLHSKEDQVEAAEYRP